MLQQPSASRTLSRRLNNSRKWSGTDLGGRDAAVTNVHQGRARHRQHEHEPQGIDVRACKSSFTILELCEGKGGTRHGSYQIHSLASELEVMRCNAIIKYSQAILRSNKELVCGISYTPTLAPPLLPDPDGPACSACRYKKFKPKKKEDRLPALGARPQAMPLPSATLTGPVRVAAIPKSNVRPCTGAADA